MLRYRFRMMSSKETISLIIKTGCYIARFGGEEFGIIAKTNNPDFQSYDDKLAKRLSQVCIAQDSRVLFCIPHSFLHTCDCNDFAKEFWEWWLWNNNNFENIANLLHLNMWKQRVFGDAQITRPYMDWKNRHKAKERFLNLKKLWQGRDVLIVEGTNTKLGVGNDLLDNTSSIRRILAPSKNAFSLYDTIFESALSEAQGKLVLIALGPTATVLAYDLAIANIQALDIGHIDIEYEWFLQGADRKTAIAGKATQEAHTHIDSFSEDNEEYQSQIILRIEG